MLAKTARFTPVVCAVLYLAYLCFAAGLTQLEQVETVFKKGEYERVAGIYQQVITEYPRSEDAFAAGAKEATC